MKLEIETRLDLRGVIELAGKRLEIAQIAIRGFEDKDHDGDIEVGIGVKIAGHWIVGGEDELKEIELPTSMITKAVGGSADGFDDLLKFIKDKAG